MPKISFIVEEKFHRDKRIVSLSLKKFSKHGTINVNDDDFETERTFYMFPTVILESPVLAVIRDFVCGNTEISEFVLQYNQNNALADYLDSIVEYIATNDIPIKRRLVLMKNVNQNKPFELRSHVEQFIKEYAQNFRDLSDAWKNDPPKVGAYLKTQTHLTAYGAFKMHSIVADIYYQIDSELVRTEKYHEEYEFSLDVLPGYLAGGVSAENFVSQHILSKYPSTLRKGERKRLVKEEIKQAFQRDCKGFPRWIQMPEWPIGSDDKPMVYMGQKAFEHNTEYYFRDSTTNENHIVTQWW